MGGYVILSKSGVTLKTSDDYKDLDMKPRKLVNEHIKDMDYDIVHIQFYGTGKVKFCTYKEASIFKKYNIFARRNGDSKIIKLNGKVYILTDRIIK